MCSVAIRSHHQLSVTTLGFSALLVLLGSACGGHYVVRGTVLYDEGRYVEAAEVFERTEQRLTGSSDSERARFGLYRGATFLKLGDVPHAARWLGYARSIQKRDADALSDDDAALLDVSLKAIGNAAPALPDRRGRSEVATAPVVPDAVPTE